MWLTDNSNDKGQLNSGNSRVCSYRGYKVQYSILLSKNLPRDCIFHRELDHYRPCYRMARRLLLRNLFQCTPITLSLKNSHSPDVHCIDSHALYYGGASSDVIMDFITLAIPWPFVWKLHMPTRHKIAVTGMFLLGIL